jgi:hypothetical protein
VTAPNPKRQRVGWATLDSLFADAANTWVVHYSCESFYERTSGTSPRITSIAVRNLGSAQTRSFSIHQMAELQKLSFDKIEQNYDALELEMLKAFFEHVGSYKGAKYLHWNMRDINYGFAALEYRYKVLGGNPIVIDDDKKFDLSRILIDIFGTGYIGHPRIERLLEKNSIKPLNFMTGKQEADAFEQRNFVGLRQSTLRKVDVLANFATRAHDRNLKTNTTWWEMHGGHLRSILEWVMENKLISFAASVASLIGLYFLFWPPK